ncbi:hypothetical protein GCM10010199_09260 [Dactylosporangium roseum]
MAGSVIAAGFRGWPVRGVTHAHRIRIGTGHRYPRPSRASAAIPAGSGDWGAPEHLLETRGGLPAGHPDRDLLRGRAIESCLPMAHRLAGRYAGRGEPLDDLRQVAALALVRAVDRYDAGRGVPFAGYAAPTIIGALKRHFRDSAWGMRVPRSSQELLLALRPAVTDLTHLHGRAPTAAELAEHLRIDIGALHAAKQAAQAYRLPSLNEPLDDPTPLNASTSSARSTRVTPASTIT